MLNSYTVAPDLVVGRIVVTSDSAQVVLKNRGNASVVDPFWVDLYVDPDPVPTGVNQLWYQRCSQGIAWGVEGASALPLGPGGAITLTIGDGYYYPGDSNFPGSLPAGTPIYVQVDSDGGEPYGLVLESHEITGGHYNNISGPVSSTLGAIGAEPAAELPVIRDRPPASSRRLPPRP